MAGPPVTFAEVVRTGVDSALEDLHVSAPGIVVSYNAEKLTADIQPALKRALEDDKGETVYEQYPIIPNVPIMFARGGGFVVDFPLEEGDRVVLVFSDRSYSEYRATGQISEPLDDRKHSAGYPYAFPGGVPEAGPDYALTDAQEPGTLRIGLDGNKAQLKIKEDEILMGTTPGQQKFVALADKVLTELNAIKSAFDLHTHTCAAPGSPSTPPVAGLPSPGSVASTLFKTE